MSFAVEILGENSSSNAWYWSVLGAVSSIRHGVCSGLTGIVLITDPLTPMPIGSQSASSSCNADLREDQRQNSEKFQ